MLTIKTHIFGKQITSIYFVKKIILFDINKKIQ